MTSNQRSCARSKAVETRKKGARKLNQTYSAPKQFNSNELDNTDGLKFSGKPTPHEVQF